jgi:hypothetical protein
MLRHLVHPPARGPADRGPADRGSADRGSADRGSRRTRHSGVAASAHICAGTAVYAGRSVYRGRHRADEAEAELITIKQATAAAESLVRELYPVDEVLALRLEEVEIVDDSDWRITLGWNLPARPSANSFLSALGPVMGERIYKRFLVDGTSGAVKSMTIRQFQNPT